MKGLPLDKSAHNHLSLLALVRFITPGVSLAICVFWALCQERRGTYASSIVVTQTATTIRITSPGYEETVTIPSPASLSTPTPINPVGPTVMPFFLPPYDQKPTPARTLLQTQTPTPSPMPSLRPTHTAIETSTPEPIVLLNVSIISQERPLSCEAAAIRMILKSYGIEVRETQILKELGNDPNPHKCFRGDANAQAGFEIYGVYAEPVAQVLSTYDVSAQVRYHTTYEDIKSSLDSGNPVIVWISHEAEPHVIEQGEYRLVLGEHTLVVTGYDESAFWVNDSLEEGYRYRVSRFRHWDLFDNMAVFVHFPENQ